MTLNHINLMVTDVDSTVEFLETYFEMRCQANNGKFAVLFDDAAAVSFGTKH